MNNLDLECKDIIRTTEMKLNEKTSNDIIKRWERNCPQCDVIIEYKNKKCLSKSIRKQQLCRKCSRVEIKFGPI
jgi:hypothetical protein